MDVDPRRVNLSRVRKSLSSAKVTNRYALIQIRMNQVGLLPGRSREQCTTETSPALRQFVQNLCFLRALRD